MFRFAYIFICVLCAAQLSAQGWRRNFQQISLPAEIHQTPDGGAVMIATNRKAGPAGLDATLIKTDQNGRLQWQKSIGGGAQDDGRCLTLLPNGDMLGAVRKGVNGSGSNTLIFKCGADGEILWEKEFDFAQTDDPQGLRYLPDGGCISAIASDGALRMLRLDENGQQIWSQGYPQTQNRALKHLEIAPDSSWVLTFIQNNLPIVAPLAYVMKLRPDGAIHFDSAFQHISGYATTEVARAKPRADGSILLMHRDSVYTLDRDGRKQNAFRVSGAGDVYLTDIFPSADGCCWVWGTDYSFQNPPYSNAFLAKYTANGMQKWLRNFQTPNYLHATWAAAPCTDGGFYLGGNFSQNNQYFTYLLRSDSLGNVLTNQLSGRVFWDQNKNCIEETKGMEPALAGWKIRIEHPNGEHHFALTDSMGFYHAEVGLGEYSVAALPPNALWESECSSKVNIRFDTTFLLKNADFPIEDNERCPLPFVDVGLSDWLLCADNEVVLHYANHGTGVLQKAIVQLTLDSLLSITGASHPFTVKNGRNVRFELGDLAPWSGGQIKMQIHPGCNTADLRRTLCIAAHITPDSTCLMEAIGPFIIAEGRCEGDSVAFQVYNIGRPMTQVLESIIIEDDIMFFDSPRPFQLGSGGSWNLKLPANGSTWRIEARQAPEVAEWRSERIVTATVEGCGTNASFSNGYVNQYQRYDGGFFRETECREVLDTPKSNAKTGFPLGYGDEHYIPRNTSIEYLLQFQNPGPDTAFLLTLRDTIDHKKLQIERLQPGPASHPYTLEWSDQGGLTFRFENIALPDSATDPQRSRGWVKFRIAQSADLTAGTVIHNRFGLYFNYRAPIISNTTWHTVADPLLGTDPGEPALKQPFRVFPTPGSGPFWIEMPSDGTYSAILYEPGGRPVLSRSFTGKYLAISEPDLPAGVYFLTVYAENQRLGTIRLIQTR
jgi:hypothetical protein